MPGQMFSGESRRFENIVQDRGITVRVFLLHRGNPPSPTGGGTSVAKTLPCSSLFLCMTYSGMGDRSARAPLPPLFRWKVDLQFFECSFQYCNRVRWICGAVRGSLPGSLDDSLSV